MNAFASFRDFLAMDGHGAYVWSSYGIGLALLVWNAAQPILARRRYLKAHARRLRNEAAR